MKTFMLISLSCRSRFKSGMTDPASNFFLGSGFRRNDRMRYNL